MINLISNRFTSATFVQYKTCSGKILRCYSNMASASKYSAKRRGQDIILTPKSGHERTLIWLHGLGDSAEGFYDVFDSPVDPTPEKTKIVLLTAPERPVTVNGGYVCNSWYDIKSLDKNTMKEEDLYSVSEVKDSYEIIQKTIDEEIQILGNSKKIFIGGFSQGCSMSIYTGITYPSVLGGIIGLSGYFFKFIEINNLEQTRYEMPIFLSHGESDDVVPFLLARQSYQRLLAQFKNSKFQNEPFLPHSLYPKQLADIKNWFNNLPK
ncbi:hypothetical protein ABPG72_017573 [Tetrahymena utriculariae]